MFLREIINIQKRSHFRLNGYQKILDDPTFSYPYLFDQILPSNKRRRRTNAAPNQKNAASIRG